MTNQKLDASNLLCPLPLLKTKQALNQLKKGDVLDVITTDITSVTDMAAFCAQTAHQLIKQNEANGQYFFTIKKG